MKYEKLKITRLAFAKWDWFCQNHSTEVSGRLLTRPGSSIVVDCDLYPLDEPPSSASVSEDVRPHILDAYNQDKEDSGFEWPWIWVHTHPGNGATPSSTDWKYFNSLIGMGMPRVGMAILARGGDTSFHMAVKDCQGDYHVINYEKWEIMDDVALDIEALKARSAECIPAPKVVPTIGYGRYYPPARTNQTTLSWDDKTKRDNTLDFEIPEDDDSIPDDDYEWEGCMTAIDAVGDFYEQLLEGEKPSVKDLEDYARHHAVGARPFKEAKGGKETQANIAFWHGFHTTLAKFKSGEYDVTDPSSFEEIYGTVIEGDNK